jgi:glutathione S-transferase
MDGPVAFQSVLRVQANTLEQLPMLLVPLWLCATYLGDAWAAAGGLLWCLGRIVYAVGYYKDPAKRELGFITAMAASALLVLGAVVGLLMP